jgi:FkbM family methyltransferase
VWLRGRYGSEIESQLRARLRPGDAFVDVGANVGSFSVVAARIVGPAGRVIAVEPVPEVAALLEASAARNGLAHLRVVRSALGRVAGRATMQIQASSGISYLGAPHHRQADDHIRGEVDVPVERLDDLLAREDAPAPALVKIDVEGREPDVLAGAANTLAVGAAFVVELVTQNLRRFGATPEDIFAPFAAAGYIAIDVRDGQPIGPGDTGRLPTDVLFVPRSPR